MTVFAVDLAFKAKNFNKIQELSNKLQGVETKAKGAQRNITGTGKAAARAGTQAKAAAGGFNSLAGAASKLATAFALLQTGKFIFGKTAELETQTRSLKVLTGELKTAKNIIQELQQFAAVTPFTSSELVETAKRLKAFGVDTENLVDTTKRLGDVAGATGAKLDGIATAYGQIQAKGRLQGEELLQLQERGINLQDELQKMYGLTGEEFRKALEKGQFSAKAVELALKRLTDTGGKYAKGAIAQSDTLSGKLSTLQDGIDNLARRIGQVLSPALKAIFDQAIAVVDVINQALAAGRGGGFTRSVGIARNLLNVGATSQAVDNIAKGVGQVNPQANKAGIEQNLQALQKYQRLLQSISPKDPNADRAVQLQKTILQKIDLNLAALEKAKKAQSGGDIFKNPTIPPPLLNSSGGSSGGGRAGASSDVTKQLQESLKAGQELSREFTRQVELLKASSDIDKSLLQIRYDHEDRLRDISGLMDAQQQASLALQSSEIKRLETLELMTEAAERFKDAMQLDVGYGKGGVANLQELTTAGEMAAQAGKTLGDAFSGSFKGIADGTKTAQEAISDFFKKIGNALLDYAAMAIAQYIAIGFARMFAGMGTSSIGGTNWGGMDTSSFGGGFGVDTSGLQGPLTPFASGGYVSGPTNALIGEAGNEYVIPERKMGAAMQRWNAGQRGDAVVDGADGASGANGAASGITLNVTATRIADDNWVKVDDLNAALAKNKMESAKLGAQMGEQRTLSKLRNNPGARQRIGI